MRFVAHLHTIKNIENSIENSQYHVTKVQSIHLITRRKVSVQAVFAGMNLYVLQHPSGTLGCA